MFPGSRALAIGFLRPLVLNEVIISFTERTYDLFQDHVAKEQLVKSLHQEFVTVVNDVGVDPNRLLEHPHTVALLQFVCGLGPRKASSLLKVQ